MQKHKNETLRTAICTTRSASRGAQAHVSCIARTCAAYRTRSDIVRGVMDVIVVVLLVVVVIVPVLVVLLVYVAVCVLLWWWWCIHQVLFGFQEGQSALYSPDPRQQIFQLHQQIPQ